MVTIVISIGILTLFIDDSMLRLSSASIKPILPPIVILPFDNVSSLRIKSFSKEAVIKVKLDF